MLHVSVKRNATQKMDEFVLLHTMPRVHRPRPVPVVSVPVARYIVLACVAIRSLHYVGSGIDAFTIRGCFTVVVSLSLPVDLLFASFCGDGQSFGACVVFRRGFTKPKGFGFYAGHFRAGLPAPPSDPRHPILWRTWSLGPGGGFLASPT